MCIHGAQRARDCVVCIELRRVKNKLRMRLRAPQNNEKRRAKARARYEANREEVLAKNKQWYNANKEKHKTRLVSKRREKLYGLSEIELRWRLLLQDQSCAICKKPLVTDASRIQDKNKACVDHCHRTGRVRGLLCTGCNKGLGIFGDNPVLLGRAIDYLKA